MSIGFLSTLECLSLDVYMPIVLKAARSKFLGSYVMHE